MLGHQNIVIAGGMENMSLAPYLVPSNRWGSRMGHTSMHDCMILDGLWCALGNVHMGITAENIVSEFGISRNEQDCFALQSQQRAIKAIENKVFEKEIVPIQITQKRRNCNCRKFFWNK